MPVNKFVPVNKLTKKVDFSAASLISDDIFFVPWASNAFQVFLKTDTTNEQVPPQETDWDPWTPFSSKWAVNVAFAQLLVEFKFKLEPLFDRPSWVEKLGKFKVENKDLCIKRADYFVAWRETF